MVKGHIGSCRRIFVPSSYQTAVGIKSFRTPWEEVMTRSRINTRCSQTTTTSTNLTRSSQRSAATVGWSISANKKFTEVLTQLGVKSHLSASSAVTSSAYQFPRAVRVRGRRSQAESRAPGFHCSICVPTHRGPPPRDWRARGEIRRRPQDACPERAP